MASIYDNWMRGLDNDPAGSQEQEALLSYLNSTTTADEAAHEYTKKVTESENFSAELTWSLLIEAAEEFPQAHQKLVELLDVFARLPWTEKGMARKSGGNLTEFVFELRDAFDGTSNFLVLSLIES